MQSAHDKLPTWNWFRNVALIGIIIGIFFAPDAAAAPLTTATTTSFPPVKEKCVLPAPNKANGAQIQWIGKKLSNPESDTYFSPNPTSIGADKNWYVNTAVGQLFTRVVYIDHDGVCHHNGTMLVQYDVHVKHVKGIDPTATMTRAVFTMRKSWKQFIGAEISILPIQPSTRYYAEWQPTGKRASLTATPKVFVEHNNPAPTTWSVGNATQYHWVVNAAYKPSVKVLYTRNGRRHMLTNKTVGKADSTLDVILPKGSKLIASMVSGS